MFHTYKFMLKNSYNIARKTYMTHRSFRFDHKMFVKSNTAQFYCLLALSQFCFSLSCFPISSHTQREVKARSLHALCTGSKLAVMRRQSVNPSCTPGRLKALSIWVPWKAVLSSSRSHRRESTAPHSLVQESDGRPERALPQS